MADQTDATIRRVKDAYEQRAMDFLRRCAKTLRDAGFYADEPVDMSADDYEWSLTVWADRDAFESRRFTRSAEVTLKLNEAMSYGDDDSPYGVNFSMDVIAYGGRILAQFQPFNYTPRVWVDARDDEAVAQRWQLFEDLDLLGLPHYIHELERIVA